ncbi:hypothetical protein EV368DRAFT_69332 [Lentinula lateritia]|nr:hypothetical protein EV368DRAFT_69332 [Lentinula lateritia]
MALQQMLFSEIFGSVQSYFILVMFEVLFLVLKLQSTTVLSIIEETHLTVLQINLYLEVHTSTLGLSFDDGLFVSYSILIAAKSTCQQSKSPEQAENFALKTLYAGECSPASILDPACIQVFKMKGLCGTTANIIADTILLYRCYLVWGSRKYITPSLAILSLVNTVVAVLGVVLVAKNDQEQVIVQTEYAPAGPEIISLIFPSINLFTNLALTGLIGKLL